MSVDALAAWLLSVMMSAVPPGKSRAPDARETVEEGEARYRAIAQAIAEVSLDPKEEPLYTGERAREKTAALMLAVSYHESHWRRDVDLGIGPKARGGGGRYHCLMQIGVPKGKTPEGWTPKQLVQSRERCFRRGLHILQRGRRHCRGRGAHAFLNHYASGYCDRGRKAVSLRVRTLDRWLRERPFEPRAR
jgi:hypothetical protein